MDRGRCGSNDITAYGSNGCVAGIDAPGPAFGIAFIQNEQHFNIRRGPRTQLGNV